LPSKKGFAKKATLKEVLWIRDSRKETIWSDKKENARGVESLPNKKEITRKVPLKEIYGEKKIVDTKNGEDGIRLQEEGQVIKYQKRKGKSQPDSKSRH